MSSPAHCAHLSDINRVVCLRALVNGASSQANNCAAHSMVVVRQRHIHCTAQSLNVLRRSHSGITRLYQNVRLNGYQILFLSSRAIAQARLNVVMQTWHLIPACWPVSSFCILQRPFSRKVVHAQA